MQPGLLLVVAISLSAIMAFAWALERKTGKKRLDRCHLVVFGWGGLNHSRHVCRCDLAAAFSDTDPHSGVVSSPWLSHRQAQRAPWGRPRYARLIKNGAKRIRSPLLVLQIQALAAFILVVTVYLAVVGRPGFPYVGDMVGVAIIAIALIGEALSDAQLAQFRMTPEAKTEICETGLWAFPDIPTISF